MSYFDDPVHSTGALTTALSTHASDVKGVGKRPAVSVFLKESLICTAQILQLKVKALITCL